MNPVGIGLVPDTPDPWDCPLCPLLSLSPSLLLTSPLAIYLSIKYTTSVDDRSSALIAFHIRNTVLCMHPSMPILEQSRHPDLSDPTHSVLRPSSLHCAHCILVKPCFAASLIFTYLLLPRNTCPEAGVLPFIALIVPDQFEFAIVESPVLALCVWCVCLGWW